jgi:hypothetical protein
MAVKTITIEIETTLHESDLHEFLCKAIHELDAMAWIELHEGITDIRTVDKSPGIIYPPMSARELRRLKRRKEAR